MKCFLNNNYHIIYLADGLDATAELIALLLFFNQKIILFCYFIYIV